MVQWSACFLVPALALVAACAVPSPDLEARLPTPTGSVFVRSMGRGPDVVLLHGLGDSSIGWRKLEPRLREAGFRVTVWDALGMNFGDPRRITDEDVQAYVGEIERQGSLRGFIEQQLLLMPTPEEIARWTGAYPTIAVPVLLLWGTRDRILPRAQGPRLAAALPNARLVELEGLGHTPQLEAPDVVLAHLLPFLIP